MAKYIMINEYWETNHIVVNDFDELIPMINKSLKLNQLFKIDCFNGIIENPQPPTIKEYEKFLNNMIAAGIGDDYQYFL